MFKKFKSSVYSCLVIVLSFCLIVGSTYALFTSEAKISVSVTSGKVNLESTINEKSLELFSLDVKQSENYFENGGTAELNSEEGKLDLNNMTPGDKVNFVIDLKNNSNINIKYRLSWEVDGELKDALKMSANDIAITNNVSEWFDWLQADETLKKINVSIELPLNTDNKFQNKSASLLFKVEAVQGNASGLYEANIVTTNDELKDALLKGGIIYLDESLTLEDNVVIQNDTEIIGNNDSVLTINKDISLTIKEKKLLLNGVVIKEEKSYGFDENNELFFDNLDNRRKGALFNVTDGGEIELDGGTVIENITSKGSSVISVNGNDNVQSSVVIKNAIISGCAGKSGTVIDANNNALITIEEGAEIKDNISYDCSNHGIIKVYTGSVLTINGGKIYNNRYSGNGLIGIWNASAVMNGGLIYDNSFINRENTWIDDESTANSRYGLIYVHKNSLFTMNGGEISNNIVSSKSCGVIDAVNAYNVKPNIVINGGKVVDNIALNDNNLQVFCCVNNKEHLLISDQAVINGTIYEYETKEYTYFNQEIVNNNGKLINVSNNSTINKVTIDNSNINVDTLISLDKPLELWITDSVVNCNIGIDLLDNSINNTIVLSNAEFNIGNGKVININSSNLPTVVYILNTLKINDNIINKDNYMNYFDSNITVIFN